MPLLEAHVDPAHREPQHLRGPTAGVGSAATPQGDPPVWALGQSSLSTWPDQYRNVGIAHCAGVGGWVMSAAPGKAERPVALSDYAGRRASSEHLEMVDGGCSTTHLVGCGSRSRTFVESESGMTERESESDCAADRERLRGHDALRFGPLQGHFGISEDEPPRFLRYGIELSDRTLRRS